MASLTSFLMHFFVCFSLTNSSEISELYMSVQHGVSFEPTINGCMIEKFTFINNINCPAMCLNILGCQLVMYNFTDSSCSIYNSTNGVFNSLDGHIVYTVYDTITTISTTTETITITSTTANPSTEKTTTISTTANPSTEETTTVSTTANPSTEETTTVSTTANPSTEETATISTTTNPSTEETTEVDTSSAVTVSYCVTGTFPEFKSGLLALWRFDNTVNDDNLEYQGTLMGGATFSPQGYIVADLSLTDASSYVEMPYVNLISSSFTIELWIRIEYFSGTNMTLVSQDDLALRVSYNGTVFISEIPSSAGIQLVTNKWYHIALIYNIDLLNQQIYVNGNLDSTSTENFNLTVNTAFYIGTLDGTSEFFHGEIDHLSIATRVKSACEILRDASLVAFYGFSPSSEETYDSGPYAISGYYNMGSGDPGEGVVDNGLLIDGNSVYFQVSGLTPLTIIDGDFSYTLFIKPYSFKPCSLIYLSGTNDISDTGQARPYLGIDIPGNLAAELPPAIVVDTSANIVMDDWNHVALTYSSLDNRVSVYHNGIFQASVPGPTPYNPPVTTPPLYVTVANALDGPNGSVIPAQTFDGSIDEFYIWSRELSAGKVYAAATVT